MAPFRNWKLHPTRNDVEWQGPRSKVPKTWGPDYVGPAGQPKRPRRTGTFTGTGTRPALTEDQVRAAEQARYEKGLHDGISARYRARLAKWQQSRLGKVITGGSKFVKKARPGLIAPVTGFMNTFATLSDNDKRRFKMEDRRRAEINKRRRENLFGKRTQPKPIEQGGQKRPGGDYPDERPAKRPGRPVHQMADDPNPFGPVDDDIPTQPNWPGGDPDDNDPDDDGPKGGAAGYPDDFWSRNTGAHNAPAPHNGDCTRRPRSAACIGSSSVCATR